MRIRMNIDESLHRVLVETEQQCPPASLPVFSGDTGPVVGVDLASKESVEGAIEGWVPRAQLR
ncbi:hypothetical protein IM660_15930 [Ruania alkalisoli]|uniref:Uncharacterized protein n=1 Tax=Ruania alkalisoli TaxID=2779775 RepID=A0A7M1SRB3_9MICO|nr:hypothetical protein [Ruania alkalisoli]QOR70100.1 hypothetical protein IM660_15930 [Ruania alkalisoli]